MVINLGSRQENQKFRSSLSCSIRSSPKEWREINPLAGTVLASLGNLSVTPGTHIKSQVWGFPLKVAVLRGGDRRSLWLTSRPIHMSSWSTRHPVSEEAGDT